MAPQTPSVDFAEGYPKGSHETQEARPQDTRAPLTGPGQGSVGVQVSPELQRGLHGGWGPQVSLEAQTCL